MGRDQQQSRVKLLCQLKPHPQPQVKLFQRQQLIMVCIFPALQSNTLYEIWESCITESETNYLLIRRKSKMEIEKASLAAIPFPQNGKNVADPLEWILLYPKIRERERERERETERLQQHQRILPPLPLSYLSDSSSHLAALMELHSDTKWEIM
jgi:hypothetical protein